MDHQSPFASSSNQTAIRSSAEGAAPATTSQVKPTASGIGPVTASLPAKPQARVLTEQPFATESNDFLIYKNHDVQELFGSGVDNYTNFDLIDRLREVYRHKPTINCLDLGSAGGQFIVDLHLLPFTKYCVGIDGGCAELGLSNWQRYRNKVLFNADLTKQFQVVDEQGDEIKFDVITCWETIEHLKPEDLRAFFVRVRSMLSPDGIFIGSIAMCDDIRDSHGNYIGENDIIRAGRSKEPPDGVKYVLHHSIFDPKTWRDLILRDFKVHEYPFKNPAAQSGNLAVRDHSNSFYFMITR